MKNSLMLTAVLTFIFLTFGSVQGATFTVTKTADTNDGVCDSDCSLREAVVAATFSPQSSDIIESSSFFDVPRTIFLDFQSSPGVYEPLSITKSLEIRGKGPYKLTLSGDGNVTLFNIEKLVGLPIATVVIRDLNLTNSPGAIYNEEGNLTIDNCYISENILEYSKFGGAGLHHHAGTLIVNNSTFEANEITQDAAGAAISLYTGNATITNSTFVGNSATRGSVFHSEFGIANFINSTIIGNSPQSNVSGPSIVVTTASGTINLINTTVTRNRVRINGSAVGILLGQQQPFAVVNIKNTIVAGNIAVPSLGESKDASVLGINPTEINQVTSLGNNIVGFAFPNQGFPVGSPNANGDFVGEYTTPFDPLLDQLNDNGGPTETLRPLPGSVAIDNGTSVGAPIADQRGAARPFGSGVDIGSVETGVPVISAITSTGSNVAVQMGTVSVSFSNVSTVGSTTQLPINPASAGSLPGGFSFGAGLPAFDVTTTVLYTGPIVVCIELPNITDSAYFNTLRLFHRENGALVDRTVSRDFPTRTICAQTTSLSPFAVADSFAPTASNVSVSGRVMSETGGLGRARVRLTEANGNVRSTVSNSFGYYRFDGLVAGQTVLVEVNAKGHRYGSRVVSLDDNLTDVDFVPLR